MTVSQTLRRTARWALAALLMSALLLSLGVVLHPERAKTRPAGAAGHRDSTRSAAAAISSGAEALQARDLGRNAAAAQTLAGQAPAAGAASPSGGISAARRDATGRGHHGLFTVTDLRPDCTLFSFVAESYEISDLERTDGRFAQVRSATGWPLALRGAPALPVYRADLLLPEQGDYDLQLLASEYVDIPCLPPVPSCGMLLRSTRPFASAPDPAIYGGVAPFPAQVLAQTERYRLRGAAGLAVQVAPFQYYPAAGVVRVYTRLDMALRCAASRAEDYPALSNELQYAQLQSDAFLNSGLLRQEPTPEPATVGTILMLCPDAWMGALADFVAWKERVGFRVMVAGYPGDTGTGAAALKAFIQSAYTNEGISHVLLCGDEQDLPPYERSAHVSNPGAYPPTTDIPYAWVDGEDVYADLFLSRLSASSGLMLGRILTKLRRYEEQAALEDEHAGRALFVASDASGSEGISAGIKDWAFLNEYRQTLIAGGSISDDSPTLYDPGASVTTLISHLNDGVGLLYYLGHGQNTFLTTTGFSSAQAKALVNEMALPFIVSPVCNNGNFAYERNRLSEDCLAEAFFKATAGGGERHGAAALVASTSETYWNPPIYLLEVITGRVVAATSAERLQSVGAYSWAGIFAGIAYAASSSIAGEFDGVDAPAEYFSKQMHVFGDASQVARLRRLEAMTVSHTIDYAAAGPELLTVRVVVADSAAPLAGAAVCVQAPDGSRLAAGRTSADGIVTLAIDGEYDTVSLSVLDAAAPFFLSDIRLGATLLTPQVQLPSGWPAAVALALSSGAAEWTLLSGDLPEGVALAADGNLSGTAAVAGTYEVQVHAVPQNAPDSARDYSLAIEVVTPVETAAMMEFYVGQEYDQQLSLPAEYAHDACRCVGVAGTAPTGMVLTADARCVGQPTEPGVKILRCLYHAEDCGYLAVDYQLVTYAAPDADGNGMLSHQELLQFLQAWYNVGGLLASRNAVIGQWAADGLDTAAAVRRADDNATARVDEIPVGTATPWRVAVLYRKAEELQALFARGLEITSIQDAVVWLELSEEQWRQVQEDDFAVVSREYLPAHRRSDNPLYLSYEAMNERLLALAAHNWAICRPDYVGQTTQGRDILALRIGANSADNAVPELLLTGAIHGDERPGAMLALRFAEYVLAAYAAGDQRVRGLLDKVAIWVMPMANPDGVAAVTRKNANNVDLNRSFPDGIVIPGLGTYAAASPMYQSGRQLETRALMRWCAARRFSAALHFHTGARLVCYPYGNNATGTVTGYESATPDHALFRSLAGKYAVNHTAMAQSDVINSSAWYICEGEYADWQYRYLGTLAMTVELMGPATAKESTDPKHLDRLWEENRDALLGWAEQAFTGIAGLVRDHASGQPVPHARIRVVGTQDVFSDRQGHFHRTLSPGSWLVTVSAPGYADVLRSVTVLTGECAQLDVTMNLNAACWLEPQFDRTRYVPTYDNTLGWHVQTPTDGEALDAWIVSCALPAGWAPGLGDDAVDAVARRWDNATMRSWLFLREDGLEPARATLSLRGVDNPSADGIVGFTVRRLGAERVLPSRYWLSAEPKAALIALQPGWNFIGLPLYARATASLSPAGQQLWRWTPSGYRLSQLGDLPVFSAAWVYMAEDEQGMSLELTGWQAPDGLLNYPAGWTAFCCDWSRPVPRQLTGGVWSFTGYGVAHPVLNGLDRLPAGRGSWFFSATPGRWNLHD